MVFAYDSEMALQAAVELVNSATEPEALSSVAELSEFFQRRHYTGRHDRTRAELDEVRALRPALREVLLADREAAVGLVNRMLAEVRWRPELVRHDDYDWHLHAVHPDAPLAERIQVETAMAMVDVIRAEEHSRFGPSNVKYSEVFSTEYFSVGILRIIQQLIGIFVGGVQK